MLSFGEEFFSPEDVMAIRRDLNQENKKLCFNNQKIPMKNSKFGLKNS